jgi:Na+-transporting NADH:ubiquinone oxidoreductase subunit NqrE
MGNTDFFVLANVLLSLFVLAFAWYSVHHVWKNKNRRAAWLLMLSMGVVLFITQSMNLLTLTGLYKWSDLMPFMDLIFLVLLLFTVVFQYHLILSSHMHAKKAKKATKSNIKTSISVTKK